MQKIKIMLLLLVLLKKIQIISWIFTCLIIFSLNIILTKESGNPEGILDYRFIQNIIIYHLNKYINIKFIK